MTQEAGYEQWPSGETWSTAGEWLKDMGKEQTVLVGNAALGLQKKDTNCYQSAEETEEIPHMPTVSLTRRNVAALAVGHTTYPWQPHHVTFLCLLH